MLFRRWSNGRLTLPVCEIVFGLFGGERRQRAMLFCRWWSVRQILFVAGIGFGIRERFGVFC